LQVSLIASLLLSFTPVSLLFRIQVCGNDREGGLGEVGWKRE
jgi:hypothetical protein